MNQCVLSVEQLTKIYYPTYLGRWQGKQPFTAVNGISFNLNEGEILGLLGPNGAGKTTTTQMLLGTLTPTAGTINYFGKNFFDHRSTILQQVSFASAYVKLPGQLTVHENLDIFAKFYGLTATERAKRIKNFLSFFDMWNLRDRETARLSAGQMTRVMLAKAFLTKPKILLLDEPTASLDPDVAHDVLAFIRKQQHEEGVAILFTSHNMEEVAELCDRVLVLQNGVIIANDKPAHLAAHVATARISLIMDDQHIKKALLCTQQNNLTHSIEKNTLIIEIDEHRIAEFLTVLSTNSVWYSHISINKPTLKDYFLHISQQARAKKSA